MSIHGRRTRISFVIGSLEIGGAETQLVRLVNGLDRDRFEPSIICTSHVGPLATQLAPDVPVVAAVESRGRSRLVYGTRLMGGLAASIRRQRPDIVHAYLPAAYVLAALAAWSVRVRLIVAGRRALANLDLYGAVRWRYLARLANRLIDVHVCNSNAVRESAITVEGVRRDRTRVVYNGIDLPSLDARATQPEWASSDGLAVMVANLIRYKGHREVIEAVARVARRHPGFRLVLVGEGPERGWLTARVAEHGIASNVVFAGTRPDAARLLPAFDFSVLGSSEEGFPNAVMESMACGVPVVATGVGGVPELVEDGVQGRLVRFGDIGAMADAVCWMIEHAKERERMGQAGRKRIGENFSIDRMVGATEAVYEEFLAPRRAGAPAMKPQNTAP